MLVTDVGMTTLVKELHPQKALSPMLVTDVGMATLIKELHLEKAYSPMLVTDVGIVTLVTLVLSTPHPAQESSPSPVQSGPLMCTVPSGTAKCTPPPSDGDGTASAIFGIGGTQEDRYGTAFV